MNVRSTLATATTVLALLATAGCAVNRGQETVGAYVDDSTITTKVKTDFATNKQVDATSIKVETLNGTVMLSGFAKDANERATAEDIATKVKGVKSVKNQIIVR